MMSIQNSDEDEDGTLAASSASVYIISDWARLGGFKGYSASGISHVLTACHIKGRVGLGRWEGKRM